MWIHVTKDIKKPTCIKSFLIVSRIPQFVYARKGRTDPTFSGPVPSRPVAVPLSSRRRLATDDLFVWTRTINSRPSIILFVLFIFLEFRFKSFFKLFAHSNQRSVKVMTEKDITNKVTIRNWIVHYTILSIKRNLSRNWELDKYLP